MISKYDFQSKRMVRATLCGTALLLALYGCHSQGGVSPAAAPLPAPAASAVSSAGCPPYRDGRTYDASPIVDAIDTNKDGKMTHKEWEAAGAPEPSWNMFQSLHPGQGYITREQFLKESPPPGIDTNCDGKITMEEFLATKNHPPGPPPGGGGAPGAKP